jgi:hypothetical protein
VWCGWRICVWMADDVGLAQLMYISEGTAADLQQMDSNVSNWGPAMRG